MIPDGELALGPFARGRSEARDKIIVGSEAAHREVGRLAAECRVQYLGLVGAFAGFTAEAAGVAGMAEEQVRVFADKEEAAAWIENLVRDGKLGIGDWLLVKASRGLKLETVVARLTGKA